MGYGLPYPFAKDPGGQVFWRFMIIFPAILIILQIIMFLTVFKEDTPKWLVQKDKLAEAKLSLTKIFRGSNEAAMKHYNMLLEEKRIDSHASSVTMKDLFSKKYRKRTITGMLMTFFFQMTGVYVILNYSTEVFLGSEYATTATPTIAMYYAAQDLTVLLGTVEFLTSLIPAACIHFFGRTTILKAGFITMGLIYGLYAIVQHGTVAQVAIIFLILIPNFSIESVTWIYIPEILPDIGVGFAFISFWATDALLIFAFPLLAQYTTLGNAFLLFLSGSVAGFIWTSLWVKETKDKSNSEIVKLYCPQEFLSDDDNPQNDEKEGFLYKPIPEKVTIAV